ncbi:MAG: hypothetical protein JNM06_18815, partial [Blastocatellia bacterium]|nr:hypothetical protein [Blastocatellia bacterium]
NGSNGLDNQKTHKTPSIDTVFYAEKQSIRRSKPAQVQVEQETNIEENAPFSC